MSKTEGCEALGQPFVAARNDEQKAVIIYQPRCKKWSCAYCAEVNKAHWAIRCYHGAEVLQSQGRQLMFVTITCHEKLTVSQALYVWPKAWKKLSARIAYREGRGRAYIAIAEQHKTGKLHVHMISDWTFTNRWLKQNARNCGLGYMNEISPIETPKRAAWYVTKYLSKSLRILVWPKGFRRVNASQNWPKLPKAELSGWEYDVIKDAANVEARREFYEWLGYTVHYSSPETAFGTMSVYSGVVLD